MLKSSLDTEQQQQYEAILCSVVVSIPTFNVSDGVSFPDREIKFHFYFYYGLPIQIDRKLQQETPLLDFSVSFQCFTSKTAIFQQISSRFKAEVHSFVNFV